MAIQKEKNNKNNNYDYYYYYTASDAPLVNQFIKNYKFQARKK